MTELDRHINDLMLRFSLNLLLYLVGLAQMLAISKLPHITCGFAWIALSLSLVMFAVSCFYLYHRLRLLRAHSAEMKQVAAELNKNRQRLLELGIYHDAFLAEMAGVWAVPGSATLLWGIVNALCFVVFSVPLISAEYTFECGH
ncbi:hypothetical protein NL676_012662 [Syzygium grande]|nr:hypothetical protein NL676_012662 [Syzygium grande]